ISLALPLKMEHERHAYLLLGERQSGEIFSNQDLEVLQIVGPQLSVAMQNAWSYQQIRLFNITLKQEVDRATTQLQEANHQLHAQNTKLQQLDKLKDEFISITSHELRTP